MRVAVVAAAVCHSVVGVATADNAGSSVRKLTHIAAQDLGPALKQLAQSRSLQVLYLSTTVRDVQTRGANGDITANEAFDQLLDGTGLTYRYLDENTVTIVPLSDPAPSEGPGASLRPPAGGATAADSRAQHAKTLTSDRILLAQAGPGSAQQAPPVPADSPSLQEIIVTGSRIAAPNEVSTSPIQVISAKSIQVSGKTDITDIISQLPQILTNDLGQDLGNGTSGLTSAGGVATADLRGLGPGRTLVLIDGRRLGVGSPNTAIAQPAPDLDQIPAGLVDHVEVVTGGASAAYGSDAIAGVVNFIMKRDFQGFQVDGQVGENWHDNDDTFVQGLVRQFGYTPPTGTARDGRNRTFDMLMGDEFRGRQRQCHGLLELPSRRPYPEQISATTVPANWTRSKTRTTMSSALRAAAPPTRISSCRSPDPTREPLIACLGTASSPGERSRLRPRPSTTVRATSP